MEKGKKIPKSKSTDAARNYERLLSEGKKYLEELTGRIWNDFNLHDPGITILELLCYAITDLGYRCNHPINDIIEYDPTNKGKDDTLFPPEIIFPVRAYSVSDLRKLLINIKNENGCGINNAWFSKANKSFYVDCYKSELTRIKPDYTTDIHSININGLYDIKIELDETIALPKAKEKIIKEAWNVLEANRNLCEDYNSISIIDTEDFIICAQIEIESETDKDYLQAQIFFKIQEYLTPQVRFYSFKEMLKRGKKIEEIYEGPLLSNGFIDDDELTNSELRTEIRLSDIINIIMSIKGVKAVKEIFINELIKKKTESSKWLLYVKSGCQPRLNIGKCSITFFAGHLPLTANMEETEKYLNSFNVTAAKKEDQSTYLKVTKGSSRNIDDYKTIQNHFPLNYGIGEIGLPESASGERKAQAKQLKAYLLFFEQVLANYLSQLAHVKDLFSIKTTIDKTYFTKLVTGIEGLDELLSDKTEFLNTVQKTMESQDIFLERRNKFLNHLLSRFSENFNEYVMTLYTYVDSFSEQDIINSKLDFLAEYPMISSLRGGGLDYTKVDDVWNTMNVEGLKLRVARALGFKNFNRRDLVKMLDVEYLELDKDNVNDYRFRIIDDDKQKILLSSSGKYLNKKNMTIELNAALTLAKDITNYQLKQTKDGRFYFNLINESNNVIARRIEYFPSEEKRTEAIQYLINFLKEKFDDEGFFIVEHILLVPQKADDKFLPICVDPSCSHCEEADPYSMRITVLLPAWSERFINLDFRKFVERTIRLETPAHILPRICWVDREDMSDFERVYKEWLEYLASHKTKKRSNLLNKLIDVLNRMKSIYPEAILHDGSNPEITESPVILDKTNLGTNKT